MGAGEAVEERGVARDPGGEEHAARAEDAAGFAQGREAVGALGQVIQGAEQEGGVERRVCVRQVPRVADFGGGKRVAGLGGGSLARLPHVELDRVEQVDFVAPPRERQRVNAGSAADVHDTRGGGWEVAAQDGLDALELERAERVRGEARGLQPEVVVSQHLGQDRLGVLRGRRAGHACIVMRPGMIRKTC